MSRPSARSIPENFPRTKAAYNISQDQMEITPKEPVLTEKKKQARSIDENFQRTKAAYQLDDIEIQEEDPVLTARKKQARSIAEKFRRTKDAHNLDEMEIQEEEPALLAKKKKANLKQGMKEAEPVLTAKEKRANARKEAEYSRRRSDIKEGKRDVVEEEDENTSEDPDYVEGEELSVEEIEHHFELMPTVVKEKVSKKTTKKRSESDYIAALFQEASKAPDSLTSPRWRLSKLKWTWPIYSDWPILKSS